MPVQKSQPVPLESGEILSPVDGSFWLDKGFFYSDGAGNIVVNSVFADSGNITTDGNGNLKAASLNPAMGTVAPVAIVTGATIVIPALTSVVRLAPAAAVTGIIMPAGTRNGQIVIVMNTSVAANSITFAAASSNVAQGSGLVIAGLQKYIFVWDNVGLLWY